MKVSWLPIALGDRRSQLDYLADRSLNAALHLGDAIAAASGRLADHPESGRAGRVAGTRELVVPRTPFILVYRIEPDAVLILRLLHGAQLWPPRP